MRKREGLHSGMAVLVALALTAPVVAALQTGDEGPLTTQQLYDLITVERRPASEIVEIIKARGLRFELDAEIELNLTERAKADPSILATIKTPATLTVDVGSAGVMVSVDGEEIGETGEVGTVVLDGLAYGTHVLRFSSPNHVGKTTEVRVKPAEVRTDEIHLISAIQATPSPYGTQVTLAAGTGADATFRSANAAADPLEKIELLKAATAEYRGTPAEILGYEQLIGNYLQIRSYDDVVAASAKLVELDPRNVRGMIGQVRAALGRQDVPAAMNYAAPLADVLKTGRTVAAPEGTSPDDWEMARGAFEARGMADVQAVQYELFSAALKIPAQQRSNALERFLGYFPDSIYAKSAMTSIAIAYQEQGNAAEAVEWAEKTLEINPDDLTMLMVAGDVLSNTNQRPDRAEELLNRLLALVTDAESSVRLRPANYSDEQWESQRQLYEGLARSGIGEVNRNRGIVQPAVAGFESAAPLLKSQPFYYARNQYRWALLLASIGQRANLEKARSLLREIVAMDTPFKPHAEDLLGKINAALGG